jgi:predicted Ser/Thr protein kinase
MEGGKEAEPDSSGTVLKEALSKELSEDEVVKTLEESYKARREKLSTFLAPAQLERLDEHHKQEVEEARLAAGIFGGLLGAKVEVESEKGN